MEAALSIVLFRHPTPFTSMSRTCPSLNKNKQTLLFPFVVSADLGRSLPRAVFLERPSSSDLPQPPHIFSAFFPPQSPFASSLLFFRHRCRLHSIMPRKKTLAIKTRSSSRDAAKATSSMADGRPYAAILRGYYLAATSEDLSLRVGNSLVCDSSVGLAMGC